MSEPLPVFTPKRLGDLLTQEQFKAINRICRTEKDSIARIRKFKALLKPASAELEKKGVLDEYLAYYLDWLHTQGVI